MPGPNPLLNHDFFHPDKQTQHSAYILGFITSDGCLLKNALAFNISSKDIEILEYIKFCLSSSKDFPKIKIIPPKYTPDKFVKKAGEMSYLSFCSTKMLSDLHKFELQSRKTGHETYPYLLDPNLKYHYLRGLIDGDGSVGVYKRIRVKKEIYEPHVSIFCSNEKFLQALKNYIFLLKDFYVYKTQSCYKLHSEKLSTILNLRAALYDDAEFSLKRKRDRFFSIPEDKAYKIFGEYKTAKEWSLDSRCKVEYKTFLYRIKNNWDYQQALSHPSDKGSGARGEESNFSKLTDKQAKTIKERKLNGESTIKLAKEYNVSTGSIDYCVKYRNVNNKTRLDH